MASVVTDLERNEKYAINDPKLIPQYAVLDPKTLLTLPKHFTVEIQYKKFNDAFNASFYPGCKLKDINTVVYESDDYYEVCRALKFIL